MRNSKKGGTGEQTHTPDEGQRISLIQRKRTKERRFTYNIYRIEYAFLFVLIVCLIVVCFLSNRETKHAQDKGDMSIKVKFVQSSTCRQRTNG